MIIGQSSQSPDNQLVQDLFLDDQTTQPQQSILNVVKSLITSTTHISTRKSLYWLVSNLFLCGDNLVAQLNKRQMIEHIVGFIKEEYLYIVREREAAIFFLFFDIFSMLCFPVGPHLRSLGVFRMRAYIFFACQLITGPPRKSKPKYALLGGGGCGEIWRDVICINKRGIVRLVRPSMRASWLNCCK